MGARDRTARQWGGLALGLVFVLLGLGLGIGGGWPPAALVFTAGGLLIVVGQVAWIVASRARR